MEIRTGQIWKETDNRMERYVLVIDAGSAVSASIAIRGCDATGNRKPRSRVTYAKRERFGKSGGYTFVREGARDDGTAVNPDGEPGS